MECFKHFVILSFAVRKKESFIFQKQSAIRIKDGAFLNFTKQYI
jgi:hypothetical protein